MLAVRKIGRGIGNIEVQEVPEPQAGPEQVVVQVDAAGICGSRFFRYGWSRLGYRMFRRGAGGKDA